MKFNKIKLFGLAALLSANLSAKAANPGQSGQTNDSTSNKTVKMGTLTIQQMEDFINEANLRLKVLYNKLTDPRTSAQERKGASAEYSDLEDKRDEMQIRLNAARAGKTIVLSTDTIGQNMTIEQMQQYVNKTEKILYKMEHKLASPKITKEEYLRLHKEYKELRREFKAVKKRLEIAQRANAISFNAGRGDR